MAENIGGDLLDIEWRGIGAAVQHGVGAGGQIKAQGGARRSAHLNLVGQRIKLERFGVAGREDDIENVFADLLVAVNLIEDGAQRREILRGDCLLYTSDAADE